MNSKLFYIVFIVFVSGLRICPAANILLSFHLSGSHVAEFLAFGSELGNRGNHVYVVIPETSRFVKPISKTGITVLTFYADKNKLFLGSHEWQELVAEHVFKQLSKAWELYTEVASRHCQMILENTTMMTLLDNIGFNIAVVEPGSNYCHLLIPYVLSLPFINANALISYWNMGIPAMPSFVATFTQVANDKLSLYQKLQSIYYHFIQGSDYDQFREEKYLLEKYAPDLESWTELYKLTLFTIVYRDEVLERPSPRMPNTLFLPGMTYSKSEPLPEHLESLFEGSRKGVILIAFGTQAGYLPLDISLKFIHVFQQLEHYSFIWKLPNRSRDDLINRIIDIPTNVHIFEWLPQNDCLGHVKTSLFITHCGNNGQYESLYHAVPMLGFPLFVNEQFHNAFRIVDRGYGMSLDINKFKEHDLLSAINEIITNTSILKNVKWASEVLKSKKHPKYEAADWIEHVMHFGGCHLRGASMDMHLYEIIMLDVALFIALIVAVTILLCMWIVQLIWLKYKQKRKID